MNQRLSGFFFGNFFYGFCAIALTIEASLQQQVSLPPIIYFLFIFCITVVFYTKAYTTELTGAVYNNARTSWYLSNKQFVSTTQIILTVLTPIIGLLILPNILNGVQKNKITISVFCLFFLSVALLYYGFSKKLNLRKTHWLKPFIIGLVWSGLVTTMPLLYHQLQNNEPVHFEQRNYFLFIKNLMFIAVLAIMFDIKDYATDSNQQLKTFVVSLGLRKTIFYIILPLSVLGFASFLAYALSKNFSALKIFLNAVPFILLLLVAYSLHQRKSIFYYLIIIDGLMFVKALCGSIAMYYF